MMEEPAYTPRAEYQCDGSTTHYQGCKCHEARRQAEVDQLREKLETERMRLAACGVAAMGNTEKTAADRITKDNPYWSASYGDVCAAIDREIKLREQLAGARECLQWLESGLAGMFGTQSKSSKDEFYETAPKVVHDCLARIGGGKG